LITYNFYVDWDNEDWLDYPDFTDSYDEITAYVKRYYIERGKDVELGNVPSGTLDLTLRGGEARFSPLNASSPLYGKIRPWLPVAVYGTVGGGDPEVFYYGYISRLSINPNPAVNEVYIYCTDGMDLLARNMVTQDELNRSLITDGEAIEKILNAAGWSVGNRSIETDTEAVVNYPQTGDF
jgi:hypothetical protein